MALANLPMVPNVIPSPDESAKAPPRPLAAIHYMVTPTLDPKTNGRFGQIEVLAGPDEALYYRVFGRGKEGKGELRAAGPLGQGQADRRLRRQRQHADDDHVSGRPVPAGGDREGDLRAGRAAQGPDGQRHRRLPGRDDRRRPDQGDLAQPLGEPRPAPAADRHVSRLGLRDRLRRRPQAAGLRAQARRLRHGLRARHRAGDPLREQGPADRQVGRTSRTSRTRSG